MNLLYALVMTLTVNGQTDEYVLDKNLTREDCQTAILAPAMKADSFHYRAVAMSRAVVCMPMNKGERF